MSDRFDIVMFANHDGLGTDCIAHAHRLPFIQGVAKAMEGIGKVLVVLRYRSIPQCWFEKTTAGSGNGGLRQLDKNLWTIRPVVTGNLALAARFPLLRRLLRRQIKRQVDQAARALQMGDRRILWATHPYHYLYRGCAGETALVYECYDEHVFDRRGKSHKGTELMEKELAGAADLNITTAAALFERIKRLNERTKLVSNGVMYELFSRVRDPGLQIASEIEKIPRPVIGMIGNLRWGYDFDLLKRIIRGNPNWSFVFVGSVEKNVRDEVNGLTGFPNFHSFGWRPYEELPKFLKGFDAAMMPYQVNNWTNAMNPNKVYDYFAAGVPVVATPITELQRHHDRLWLCETEAECTAALKQLFGHGGGDKIQRAIQKAKDLSWTSITEGIIREVKSI